MTNRKSFIATIFITLLLISTLGACSSDSKSDSNSSDKTNTSDIDNTSKINDPDGAYDYKSDASITKPPEKGITIGDGTEVTIEYDKSKGDILSYQLYFVDDNGAVIAMGGSTFDDDKDGDGKYVYGIKTYTSGADGRSGFMEISSVQDSKNVYLGMYPVKFKISK